jgi:hypothetical protein
MPILEVSSYAGLAQQGLTVLIVVEGCDTRLHLDREHRRWDSETEQEESDFPLITFADGQRCELYSDGTLAEVNR